MSKEYNEIVMEGPFMLVKGFVLGFLGNISPKSKYFFHRKTGIHRETLKGFLKELFELDNVVHLCLEADLMKKFKKAAEIYKQVTGLEIKSVKPIKSAHFSFAYEFFNEAFSQQAKNMIVKLPDGVNVLDYHPLETKDIEGIGMEGYAPLHDFTARGKGTVQGDFEGVISVFLKIKRSDLSESVVCSNVKLALE